MLEEEEARQRGGQPSKYVRARARKRFFRKNYASKFRLSLLRCREDARDDSQAQISRSGSVNGGLACASSATEINAGIAGSTFSQFSATQPSLWLYRARFGRGSKARLLLRQISDTFSRETHESLQHAYTVALCQRKTLSPPLSFSPRGYAALTPPPKVTHYWREEEVVIVLMTNAF